MYYENDGGFVIKKLEYVLKPSNQGFGSKFVELEVRVSKIRWISIGKNNDSFDFDSSSRLSFHRLSS